MPHKLTTDQPSNISFVLQNLIAEKGLSVSELARYIAIPQPTIQRITSGTHSRPHRRTLEALARFFNISIEQLRGLQPISWLKNDNKLESIYKIPLITCIQSVDWPNIKDKNFEHIIFDKKISKYAFAIKMPDSSMEPVIMKNAILIIDPEKIPQYRSFVILKLKNHKEAIIRQLIQDAQRWYIRPLSDDFGKFNMVELKRDDSILGVVIEVRLICEN